MIKNILLLTFVFSNFLFARAADLTSRVQMENYLQTRIENLARAYDTNSQVVIRIEYKKYNNDLPGSAFNYTHGISPNTLETNDLVSIQVTLISDVIQKMSPQLEQNIFSSLPVEKNKIKLNLTAHSDQIPTPVYPLQSNDVSQIADQFIQNLSKIILYSLLGVCLFTALIILVYARHRSKNQKQSSAEISSALEQIGQNGLGRQSPAGALAQATTTAKAFAQTGSHDASAAKDYLNELPQSSLKELFADCYWSEQDAYAHFIWQHLSFEKKSRLISDLSFLKKYAEYFLQVMPKEQNFHSHPYYLNPVPLNHLNNSIVNSILEKNLSLWHTLSPIRQVTMQLTFDQRIKALELNVASLHKWDSQKASNERHLPISGQSIQLTDMEEKTLFDNIALVPEKFQSLVQSLLWLALTDEKITMEILSRYDARTLASCWVGHTDILTKLESYLPEKKLKLLRTYLERSTASKNSSAYLELSQLGLSAYQQNEQATAETKIKQNDAA